jgi:hypothetical protein
MERLIGLMSDQPINRDNYWRYLSLNLFSFFCSVQTSEFSLHSTKLAGVVLDLQFHSFLDLLVLFSTFHTAALLVNGELVIISGLLQHLGHIV